MALGEQVIQAPAQLGALQPERFTVERLLLILAALDLELLVRPRDTSTKPAEWRRVLTSESGVYTNGYTFGSQWQPRSPARIFAAGATHSGYAFLSPLLERQACATTRPWSSAW